MGFESFPQPANNEETHAAIEEGKIVAEIFERIKDGEQIDSLETPADAETAQEYIRKLEIMKKGTIIPFPMEETDAVHARVDAYIEKLEKISKNQ